MLCNLIKKQEWENEQWCCVTVVTLSVVVGGQNQSPDPVTGVGRRGSGQRPTRKRPWSDGHTTVPQDRGSLWLRRSAEESQRREGRLRGVCTRNHGIHVHVPAQRRAVVEGRHWRKARCGSSDKSFTMSRQREYSRFGLCVNFVV